MTEPLTGAQLGGDRTSPAAIAVIAVLSAVGVVLTGVSPTGQTIIDVVEILVVVTAVVWLGTRAPWWAQVGGGAVAAGVALAPVPLILGICAFALAAWVSPLDDGLPARQLAGALSVGLTMNSLARADVPGPVWTGPLFGFGVGALLVVTGVMRSDRHRKPVLAVGAAAVGLVALQLVVIATFASDARDAAEDATAAARRGLREARDLDTAAAAGELRAAASSLREVEERSTSWWTVPARLVPVLAQHRAVGAELGGNLADQLDRAADSLDGVDVGAVTSAPGTIDVAAVRALEAPIDELVAGLEEVSESIERTRSVWLLPQLTDRIDSLSAELADVLPASRTAQAAVEVAPAMLGEGDARRYLLLFTTPAEARGLGGFIGNYGILTIDDGRIEVEEIARRSALEQASYAAGAVISGPQDLLDTYGRFGLVREGGAVGPRSWSNLTMAPNWPSTAAAAIELYDQSADEPVDGVVVMDVYVLQTLLGYTGPIERPTGGPRLNRRNLADYLLLEQYTVGEGEGERTEALGDIAADVISRFLTSDLPPVPRLATDLGPLVDQQRLLMWTTEPDEQTVLDDVGLGAGLPIPDGRTDQFSLGLNNASASKIDAFLGRDVRFERVETETGFVVDAVVTLTNDAPSSGLPEYVIGNSIGLPDGTSRLYLVAYATRGMRAVTVDGQPVTFERGRDAEHDTAAHYVTIPPGGSVEIVYRFPAVASGDVVGRLQPLVDRG